MGHISSITAHNMYEAQWTWHVHRRRQEREEFASAQTTAVAGLLAGLAVALFCLALLLN